jgi:hypothetical protein
MKNNASWNSGLVPLPSVDYLHSRLVYNPDTGELRWRDKNRTAGCKQFRKDGSPNAIRVGFQIGEKLVQFVAHRIIAAMMGLRIPAGMVIDHRDGDPFNNKWENIRTAKHSENLANQKAQKRALPKGVFFNPRENMFMAQLRKEGKTVFQKSFKTASLAKAARDAAAVIHHGEFAHQ